jgi:alkylation response protein AidB-like acyl-CoA dehydrogenase
MINLEIPKKFKPLASQANQVATEVFRPISRKYDEAEHSYPKELDMLASLIDGMNEGSDSGAGAAGVRRDPSDGDGENRNGSNLSTVLGIIELCWGDVGLLLSMPRQGLGNSAIASVATEEQLERYGGKWAAMAITEPEAGSDSASIRRGVRAQRREDLRHLRRPRRPDRRLGDARPQGRPRGDQIVHRRARQPGAEARPARAQARDPCLRHRQLHPAGLPGAQRGAAG